jgi:3-phosphoshikimate 1-carboxyvinyltransferase
LLALRGNGKLQLPGLKAQSLQGDRAIANIMEAFGLKSTFSVAGLHISHLQDRVPGKYSTESFTFKQGPVLDFTTCPDLAQTVIACAAALRLNLSFTGLHTLRIKETDRIAALQQEIAKFGVRLVEEDPVYHLDCSGFYFPERLHIETYEDHRMAMAFAPLAEIFGELAIAMPKVVEKSYPDFWVHMQLQGFEINN